MEITAVHVRPIVMFRVGHRKKRTLYAHFDPGVNDPGQLIGLLDDPDLAAFLAAAGNAYLNGFDFTAPLTYWGTKVRVGRQARRTLYFQIGHEPSDRDQLIGMVDSEPLAAFLADAANAASQRLAEPSPG